MVGKEKRRIPAVLYSLPIFLWVPDFSDLSQPTYARYDTNTVSAEESQEGILITSESQEETNLKNNSARDHFLLIVRFTF